MTDAFDRNPPQEFSFTLNEIDPDLLALILGKPQREAVAGPPAPDPVQIVFDREVEWQGPSRPPHPSGWRRLLWWRHRRNVAAWQKRFDDWVNAGRPPRIMRTVIPRAIVERTSDPTVVDVVALPGETRPPGLFGSGSVPEV